MAHAYRVEGVIREEIERAVVFASEEDVVWTLRDFDATQEFRGGGVGVDLAGGQIDVPFGILRQALSSLLYEGCDLR